MCNLLASLGHAGKRRVVLGHTLNLLQRVITRKSHNVFSKFMISRWAALIASLSPTQPVGPRLDTPDSRASSMSVPRGVPLCWICGSRNCYYNLTAKYKCTSKRFWRKDIYRRSRALLKLVGGIQRVTESHNSQTAICCRADTLTV